MATQRAIPKGWNKTAPLRVLICGQREYANYMAILTLVQMLPPGSVIIHGAARGADSLADRAGKECGLQVIAFPAQWGQYGKAAGPIRNKQMLDEGCPDIIWAFYVKGGQDKSKGTNDMVKQTRNRMIPVFLFEDIEVE